MTSAAKIAANRRNAARSTGPRTAAGKARTRHNAFVHGLSIPLEKNDAWAKEIRVLCEKLCTVSSGRPENLLLVAEAKLALERVRRASAEIVKRCDEEFRDKANMDDEAKIGAAVANSMPKLLALERYGRRTRSQLAKALRLVESSEGA
jgi:hypothetical protein